MKISKQQLINIIKEEIENEVKHLNESGFRAVDDDFRYSGPADAPWATGEDARRQDREYEERKRRYPKLKKELEKQVADLKKQLAAAESGLVDEPSKFSKFFTRKKADQQQADRAAGQETIQQMAAELKKTEKKLKGVTDFLRVAGRG